MDLASDEARHLFVASLLHDIGHAPLSRSLEPVFAEHFSLTHHQATEEIIAGRAGIGASLYEVLLNYGINVERVIALINGQDPSFDNFFSGPINFDTLEGIFRSKRYNAQSSTQLNPENVLDAAIMRSGISDQDAVDDFWCQKNEVYKYIINSKTGILADFACQYFMRENLAKISREDYYTTEEKLFKKLRGLRPLLSSPTFELEIWRLVSEPIAYTNRTFFVDTHHDFFSRADKHRYKQSRQMSRLELRLYSEPQLESTKELFDDQRL